MTTMNTLTDMNEKNKLSQKLLDNLEHLAAGNSDTLRAQISITQEEAKILLGLILANSTLNQL